MPNAQLDRPAQLDRTDNPYRSDRSLKGGNCGLGDFEASKKARKAFPRKNIKCVGTFVATNFLLSLARPELKFGGDIMAISSKLLALEFKKPAG